MLAGDHYITRHGFSREREKEGDGKSRGRTLSHFGERGNPDFPLTLGRREGVADSTRCGAHKEAKKRVFSYRGPPALAEAVFIFIDMLNI